MGVKRQMALLGGLSVFLLSVPFLVPHTGWAALFGLVPLLCLEKIGSEAGVRRMWLWYYGVFVLWNAATTFWVCNATVGGGIFAVLANALQMAVVFALFRASKKVFRGSVPYLFLAAAWIAWERFYFSAQNARRFPVDLVLQPGSLRTAVRPGGRPVLPMERQGQDGRDRRMAARTGRANGFLGHSVEPV